MSKQLVGNKASRPYLGDTHELMTRENTDGLIHYGLTEAACGAVPTAEHDIDLADSPRMVDCPVCKTHCDKPAI